MTQSLNETSFDLRISTADFIAGNVSILNWERKTRINIPLTNFHTAVVVYKAKGYLSSTYTYHEEEIYSEEDRKFITERKFCKDDGTDREHYGGYEYNLLDSFIAFIKSLPKNTLIYAGRNGESSANELCVSTNINKPEWIQKGHIPPKNSHDGLKTELINTIVNLCIEKHIRIDLYPYYLKKTSIIPISSREGMYSVPYDETYQCSYIKYKVTYLDGYSEIVEMRNGIKPSDDSRLCLLFYSYPIIDWNGYRLHDDSSIALYNNQQGT